MLLLVEPRWHTLEVSICYDRKVLRSTRPSGDGWTMQREPVKLMLFEETTSVLGFARIGMCKFEATEATILVDNVYSAPFGKVRHGQSGDGDQRCLEVERGRQKVTRLRE